MDGLLSLALQGGVERGEQKLDGQLFGRPDNEQSELGLFRHSADRRTPPGYDNTQKPPATAGDKGLGYFARNFFKGDHNNVIGEHSNSGLDDDDEIHGPGNVYRSKIAPVSTFKPDPSREYTTAPYLDFSEGAEKRVHDIQESKHRPEYDDPAHELSLTDQIKEKAADFLRSASLRIERKGPNLKDPLGDDEEPLNAPPLKTVKQPTDPYNIRGGDHDRGHNHRSYEPHKTHEPQRSFESHRSYERDRGRPEFSPSRQGESRYANNGQYSKNGPYSNRPYTDGPYNTNGPYGNSLPRGNFGQPESFRRQEGYGFGRGPPERHFGGGMSALNRGFNGRRLQSVMPAGEYLTKRMSFPHYVPSRARVPLRHTHMHLKRHTEGSLKPSLSRSRNGHMPQGSVIPGHKLLEPTREDLHRPTHRSWENEDTPANRATPSFNALPKMFSGSL